VPTPLELLFAAIGIRNLEELEALTELPPVPLIRWRRWLLALVAPELNSPPANGIVPAGRPLRVEFKPDPVDLTHEVVLLSKSDPLNPPAPIVVPKFASTTSPLGLVDHIDINIPPDLVPGVQTEYYLEVRVQPNLIEEQKIHRRVIKTAPPLTVTFTGDQLPNPPPANPYPAATTPITYTINISGGVPPYRYMISYGDAMPGPDVPAPPSPIVLSPHTYAVGVYNAFVVVWDDAGTVQFKTAGPYSFN
jgi:hypothetical protein